MARNEFYRASLMQGGTSFYAAGQSALNGDAIDLTLGGNAQRVGAILRLGAVTANATLAVQWQQSADNATWTNLGSQYTVPAAKVTAGRYLSPGDTGVAADDAIPGCLPTQRYVRLRIIRGGANLAIAQAVYLQLNAREARRITWER